MPLESCVVHYVAPNLYPGPQIIAQHTRIVELGDGGDASPRLGQLNRTFIPRA
jgi:hypothetical protein